MAKILNIETSTTVCSIAVGIDGVIVSVNEINEGYSHAEKIESLIKKSLLEAGITLNELDAVSVSKGPGSYTGLRIGVSLAKGLCYGLDVPLISIPTLQAMSHHPDLNVFPSALKAPMLDARRMEVYACVLDVDDAVVEPTQAIVMDKDSFNTLLKSQEIVFFGPGMEKCQDFLSGNANAKFCLNVLPSAKQMILLSERKFANLEFVDVAYFEPFYLKDFVAGKPKKVF